MKLIYDQEIPVDIKKDLENASVLHQCAVSDYAKCVEFSKIMSDVLVRLEDAECDHIAGKVMSILIECNPKEGAHCDKATVVGDKMKKFNLRAAS